MGLADIRGSENHRPHRNQKVRQDMTQIIERPTLTDLASRPEEERVTNLSLLLAPLIIGSAVLVVIFGGLYQYAKYHDLARRSHQAAEARDLLKNSLQQLKQRDYTEAENLADRAVCLAPQLSTAFLFRAEARAGLPGTDKLKEAVADYTRSLALDDRETLAYYGRGQVEFRLGRTAEAEKDFSQAIHLQPGFAAAHMARSMARRRLGDAPGATQDLERARQLEPDLTVPAEK